MSQRDTSLLLREYAEWATANRFSTHLHDAQFHGLLRNTPVGIETGIRDSNLYVVVTTIYFACGLGTKVLREADARPDDPPLVLRLRHVLKSGRPVLSIRLAASGRRRGRDQAAPDCAAGGRRARSLPLTVRLELHVDLDEDPPSRDPFPSDGGRSASDHQMRTRFSGAR